MGFGGKRRCGLLRLAAVIVLPAAVPAGLADDWPMAGHDPARPGCSGRTTAERLPWRTCW